MNRSPPKFTDYKNFEMLFKRLSEKRGPKSTSVYSKPATENSDMQKPMDIKYSDNE